MKLDIIQIKWGNYKIHTEHMTKNHVALAYAVWQYWWQHNKLQNIKFHKSALQHNRVQSYKENKQIHTT